MVTTPNTTASPSFSSDLRISVTPAVDEKKYPDIYADLQLLHFAIRSLQSYLDTVITSIVIGTATEAMNAGSLVSLTKASDGTIGARLAQNTDLTTVCDAFAIAQYAEGDSGEFQTLGINSSIQGFVVGQRYYLGANGDYLTEPPFTVGEVIQEVGVGLTFGSLLFRPGHFVLSVPADPTP